MKRRVFYSVLSLITIFSITNVKAANIENVFVFDDTNATTKCVTGEESTCVKSNCIDSKTKNSCAPGTIIVYYVNNSQKHTFYVLHDDGEEITMIQRENTVDKVSYYYPDDASITFSGDNKFGPVNALASLKSATNDWSNVKTMTLKMGEQQISGNAFTGCTYSNNLYSCNTNTYSWDSSSNLKARLITTTEALNVGATSTIGKTFLKNSTNYWTMNGLLDAKNDQAIYILSTGAIYYGYTEDQLGLRAVVEITKPASTTNGTVQDSENKNQTNSTTNNSQTVKVADTGLKVSLLGYIIGIAILFAGSYCIYESVKDKHQQN